MNPRNLFAGCTTALILGFGLVACGDDAVADAVDDNGTVVVTLADYEFQDLPSSVPVGTQLSVVNAADDELHELVAFRLPDDEDRSVEDLVGLPPEEFGAVMGSLGEPVTVLLAAPGGPQISAVGDGTLDEAGRYAIFCMIPIGVEPGVYLQAAEESGEGPPQIEGAGPPHITAGMFAEITVE